MSNRNTLSDDYDFINPDHYKNTSKEVWEMMVDIWGVESFISYCEMNAFKYRMRAGLKPGQDIQRDIEKAFWYERKSAKLKEWRKNSIIKDAHLRPE